MSFSRTLKVLVLLYFVIVVRPVHMSFCRTVKVLVLLYFVIVVRPVHR